ncbi:MAG TPA: hypothetical protein VGT41_01290 [Candidatus Babeliales bacterium]|nr:hypothetical protein [Candidatus Babeliales bacterium]
MNTIRILLLVITLSPCVLSMHATAPEATKTTLEKKQNDATNNSGRASRLLKQSADGIHWFAKHLEANPDSVNFLAKAVCCVAAQAPYLLLPQDTAPIIRTLALHLSRCGRYYMFVETAIKTLPHLSQNIKIKMPNNIHSRITALINYGIADDTKTKPVIDSK